MPTKVKQAENFRPQFIQYSLFGTNMTNVSTSARPRSEGRNHHSKPAINITQLRPINRLPKHAVDGILKQASVYHAAVGESLLPRVLDEKLVHYLSEGALQISNHDGSSTDLIADDARAKNTLGKLTKDAKDIVANCPSTLIRIPWDILERYLIQYAPAELSSTLEVQEILSSTSSDWMVRLLQSDLFSILPATNIQEVLASLDFIDTFADEVVVQEGSSGDDFFVVDEGEFLVSRNNSVTGAEVELALLKTGDFFGEEALITGAPRSATVTSVGTGRLIRLDSEKFKTFVVAPAIPLLSAHDANDLVSRGALFLDVREADKYANSAIPDSANIMLKRLRADFETLDRERTYVLVDDAPNAAALAAFLLRTKGYDARCLNLPLEKYAVLQGIELGFPAINSRISMADPIETILQDENQISDAENLVTFQEIDKLSLQRQDTPADPADVSEYANTLTGIGLADLIDELNEEYDAMPDQGTVLGVSIDDSGDTNANDAIPINFPGNIEVTFHDAEPGLEISPETAAPPSSLGNVELENLRYEFERQLQAERRKQKRLMKEYKAKIAQEFRHKQATLLSNGKKLIALANKVSQQKLEIEKARKASATEAMLQDVVITYRDEQKCPSNTVSAAGDTAWSAFLRTVKN